jgi:hypothetical protein
MFQSIVKTYQAPAYPGDLASTNPRATAVATQGAFVAGVGGVTVAHFAWLDPVNAGAILSTGTGAPTGFVRKGQDALITNWLAGASMVIPQGLPVTLFASGDFWVLNSGAGAVTAGQKAFAKLSDGSISFAAAGATVAGSIETAFFAATSGSAGDLVIISMTQA